MKFLKSRVVYILTLLLVALFLRFFLLSLLEDTSDKVLSISIASLILVIGAGFVLMGTANVIEETTEVLQERTHLAGGLLQSLGTAFPDMVLGIVAALVSLKLQATDYTMAVNYAIIAASTTFGSNIYNVAHATWCLLRQNLANAKNKNFLMFPFLPMFGTVRPMQDHPTKPSMQELDTAIAVSTALTVLTTVVALSMVIFGHVATPPKNFGTDLYQLIRPAGLFVFAFGVAILFLFRKTQKVENPEKEIVAEEQYYRNKSNLVIWIHLALSGAAILFAAESMVHAIQVICVATNLPFVVAGILAGVIGCLGEMIVVHNYSVNPAGRIGDAVVGVAMDNIVTIIGASIVAIMGGIFLGGSSLILVFVIILSFNTVLIAQISKLKNAL